MSKIGITSGGAGDILLSIPVMHSLNITTLLIKESFYPPGHGSLYSVCKPLVELQGIECKPTKDEGEGFDHFEPGITYDYNMDAWRILPNRGITPIIMAMMAYWRVFRRDWKQPWIKGIPVSDDGYNLVFLTDRWRERSALDWSAVYRKISKPVYFIGLPADHATFCMQHGAIEYRPTKDLLEMAMLIGGCSRLYCNQGPALVICQGLGKQYYCEFKPGKTNTRFNTSNEHVLQ